MAQLMLCWASKLYKKNHVGYLYSPPVELFAPIKLTIELGALESGSLKLQSAGIDDGCTWPSNIIFKEF